MNIANESQQQELNRIAEGLKPFQSPEYRADCDSELKQTLDKYIGEARGQIPRRLRQFESDIVAAVVMGMLKAGKSTLVNLLARTPLASPVGFGVDTTLRPALITMADPGADVGSGRIHIYNALDMAEEPAFEKLLDYMRGIDASPASGLECLTVPLTVSNLHGTLCQKKGSGLLDQEPLLVIVEVPYDEHCQLLQDKRMLLDMPGLDSAHAAITHSAGDAGDDDSAIGRLYSRYENVIRECDLMVFVQSSVAPLNEKAATMLRNILADRPSASCYIVQNSMRARYWRTEEIQQRELERQRGHAMDIIDKIIQQNATNSEHKNVSYVAPKARTVNLGMAYDGVFSHESDLAQGHPLKGGVNVSKDNLRASSDFFELEQRMLTTLKDNGMRSRFIHCRAALLSTLDDAVKALSQSKLAKEAELSQANTRLQDWQKKKSELEQQLEEGKRFSLTGDISVEGVPEFTQSMGEARHKVAAMAGGNNISVDEANNYLVQYKTACYAEAGKFICHDATLANLRIACEDDDTKGGLRFCNDIIDKVLRNIKLEPELHVERLEKHLGKENNALALDIDGLGGFGKHNEDIERIAPLQPSDDGRRVWNPFGWFCSISQQDGVLKDKETAYQDAFQRMTRAFIREHAEKRLRTAVSRGIDEGARLYMDKMEKKIHDCHAECASLEKAITHRGELIARLNEFVDTVKELNA